MSQDFNPLKSKQLFAHPQRLHKESAWNEHVPFAMFLVELQSPHLVVELGTHWGVSSAVSARPSRKPGLEPGVMPLIPGLVMRMQGFTAVTSTI